MTEHDQPNEDVSAGDRAQGLQGYDQMSVEAAEAEVRALEAELRACNAKGEEIRRRKLTRLKRFFGIPVKEWVEVNERAMSLDEPLMVARHALTAAMDNAKPKSE